MTDSKKNIRFIIIVSILPVIIILLIFWICLQDCSQTIPISNNAYSYKDTLQLDSATLILIKNNKLEYLLDYRKNYDSTRTIIYKRIDDLECIIEKQQKCDDFLKMERWFIGVLLSLIGIIGVIIGLWSTFNLKFSYDDKKEALDKQFNKIEDDIKETKKKLNESLKEKTNIDISNYRKEIAKNKLNIIYQYGIKDFNNKNYDTARSYFNSAYNSVFRLESTCYFLGVCYKKLGDNEKALNILTEALEKNKKFPARINEIQKEIDEIKKLMNKKE
ncbi:MAG: tetratricopeptide repeat protein [Bacteroidales bacterium]|nr:tetratricopeptide repeat protein [Bacteroidales bacterium]